MCKEIFKKMIAFFMVLTVLAGIAAIVPPMAEAAGAAGYAHSEFNSSTGDVFLGGKYLELGIGKHGGFGTSTAPSTSGFHATSSSLGIRMDTDGWDMGNPPTTGDFTTPDTPEERYILSYKCDGKTYEYLVSDRRNVLSGSWNRTPTASNASSGNDLKAVVSGETVHGVELKIIYAFGAEDRAFSTSVSIVNHGDKDITNVRFVRSFDPDQDDDIYNTNDTYNKVICNPDPTKPGSEKNYAMVISRGRKSGDGFFFIAFDNRARASRNVEFALSSAYLSGLWETAPKGATYATDADLAFSFSTANGYYLDDSSIALTFDLGTILAGGSDQCVYASCPDADHMVGNLESLGRGMMTTWSADSIYNAATGNLTLSIYANQNSPTASKNKYKLVETAEVRYDGKTYRLESGSTYEIAAGNIPVNVATCGTGQMQFPYHGGDVVISAKGYVSRTLSDTKFLHSTKVYLQKESSYPVVSGLWIDNTDALNETYYADLLTSGSNFVVPEIEWSGNPGTIKLKQTSHTVNLSESGTTVTWSNHFDISEPITIIATNSKGLTTEKTLLIENSGSVPGGLSGMAVNWGESKSFTLPAAAGLLEGSKIGIGLFSNIQAKVVVEDSKVYVAIGYGNGAEWKSSSNYKKEVKSWAESIKELKKNYSPSRLKSFCKKNYKNIAKAKGSLGFDADFSILGFGEGYIDAGGKLTLLDAGLIIACDGSASFSYPFMIGPVPAFFEAKFAAELEAQLNLYLNSTASNFTPRGRLSFDISLSGGLGVGVSKVASLSGGLKGTLANVWDVYLGDTNYYQMKASLNAYAKVTLLFLSYSHDFDSIAEKVLIEYPSKKGLVEETAQESLADIYDTGNYTPDDLDYLKTGSTFVANRSAKRGELSISELGMVTNAYRNSEPQLLTLSDGTKLAVWIGYDADRAENDALCLFYSYYDGNVWSDPAQVENDGTMDGYFTLGEFAGNACLLWQNAESALPETVTLDSIAALTGMRAAFFTPEDGFVPASLTEADGALDYMPILCGDDDSVYALWVKNEDNSWYGEGTANAIMVSAYDGTEWSTAEARFEGLSSIDSLAADIDSGSMHIVYSMDNDGDVTTIDDLEVYRDGTALTENDICDSGVSCIDHVFYWYQDGHLISESEENDVPDFFTDRYQIVCGGSTKAIVYNQYDGIYSSLFARFYDYDACEWGEPIALSGANASYSSFSASADENGALHVLATRLAVTGEITDEDPYGQADIVLLTVMPKTDLAMTDLAWDGAEYTMGADMTFCATVKNTGEQAVIGYTALIMDEDDRELGRTTYYNTILSGEEKDILCGFTPEEIIPGQTVRVSVLPINAEDATPADNTASAVIDYKDIALENMSWGFDENGNAVVYSDVVNRSYNASTAPVTVMLRANTEDGEVLDTTTVDLLDPLESQRVSFTTETVPDKILYMTLSTASENENLATDSSFVCLQEYTCMHDYEEQIVAPTCIDEGYSVFNCSLCGDSYIDSYVDPLGHTWDDGVTIQPTCIANGRELYTCKVCGEQYASTLSALGHSYELTKTVEGTEYAEGRETYTCSRCKDSYEVTTGYRYAISFDDCGTVTTEYCSNNDNLTLPAREDISTADTEYHFVGWSETPVNCSETCSGLLKAGSTYLPTGSTTLYAVYMHAVEEGPMQEATIGTASRTGYSGNSPYNLYYHYATTEMLYRASEIGSGGLITDIAFNVATAKSTATNYVNIYLAETSDDSLTPSAPFYEEDLTLVYSGKPMLGTQTGWETITLDTPFIYDGISNLVVVTTQNVPSYTNSLQYYCSSSENRYIYRQADSSSGYGDVANHSYSFSSSSYLPDVKFTVDTKVYNFTSQTENIHVHDYFETTQPATCTEPGYTTRTCTICNDVVLTELAPLGHNFVGGVCERCGYTKPEAEGFVKVTDTADLTDGLYLIVYGNDSIAMNGGLQKVDSGHNNISVEIVDDVVAADTPAMAAAFEFKEMTGGWSIQAMGGSFISGDSSKNTIVEGTSAVANTITFDADGNAVIFAGGYLMFNKNTGDTNYRFRYYRTQTQQPIQLYRLVGTTPAQTHAHPVTEHDAVAPTCTESGTVKYFTCDEPTCECFGKSYADALLTEELASVRVYATGHDLVIAEPTAATCTEPAYGMGVFCANCGEVLAEPTVLSKALGHDLQYIYNDLDSHTISCIRCSYSYSEAHTYTEGRCICGATDLISQLKIKAAYPCLNENIDMIFAAEVPDDYIDPYMVFTFHGTEYRVADYSVNKDGHLCFAFSDINPQCMGDIITATLHASCYGRDYSVTVSDYSIRQYCVNQLAKTGDAELTALLSDIPTYGAAAQVYMDYKADALVIEGLDLTPSTFETISGKTVSFTGEQDENTCWTGATLVLSNDLATRFTFVTDSTNGLTVEVSINGRTQTFDTFEDAGDGKYCITFDGIKATEFDDTVTATFFRNGEQLGAAVNYSVNTYICSTQNSTNKALASLVKALYNYGASAKAYAD